MRKDLFFIKDNGFKFCNTLQNRRHQFFFFCHVVHGQYHPDINQGDRSMEKRLQAVVEAYQLLRKSALFA